MAKKIKKPTMQSQRYLPDDFIFFQILVKLPVNSLLRLTSVSKSWKACIRSSSFISAHHHHHINNKKSSSHLVYMQQNPLPNEVQDCILIPETSDGVPTQISLPLFSSKAWMCEGLICLTTKSIIYIWNPFIRTMKKIPKGEIQATYVELGFGFAPQSGDHRVVKLLWEGNYLTEVEIYSLASDSWRRIKPPSRLEASFEKKGYTKFYLRSTVSFKGSIYWLARLFGKNGYLDMILRFDLDKERFEEIEIEVTTRPELMVVNGFLVLLKYKFIRRELIHVKGYINKESESGSSSWAATKTVDLPIRTEDRVWCTTTSGHIILERIDRQMFAYDCYCDGKDLSFKLRDLGINASSWSFELIPIKETLLLLDKKEYD